MTLDLDRRQQAEAWWALIARVLAFGLGAFLLIGQSTASPPQLSIVMAGIGCLGPAVASTVATLADSLRSPGKQGPE